MAATIETGFTYYSLLFEKVREEGGGEAIPWRGLFDMFDIMT